MNLDVDQQIYKLWLCVCFVFSSHEEKRNVELLLVFFLSSQQLGVQTFYNKQTGVDFAFSSMKIYLCNTSIRMKETQNVKMEIGPALTFQAVTSSITNRSYRAIS